MLLTRLETPQHPITLGWDIIARSLTLPERARLYARCPDAFTPDPARAVTVEKRWREMLAHSAETSLEDRFADFGIKDVDLPVIVGDISEEASGHLAAEAWMGLSLLDDDGSDLMLLRP